MHKLSYFTLTALALLAGCSTNRLTRPAAETSIAYQVAVNQQNDDCFHVSVAVSGLTQNNSIYNFAATAPGTYDVMNFGRFVKSFNAYDKAGNALEVSQQGSNRWQISQPAQCTRIDYIIEDTFDSEAEGAAVAPMCGSGIEDSVAVLNTFSVLGYFEGLQSHPVNLSLQAPEGWTVGTALQKDSEGRYLAETFDHLADSPFLMGYLSVDSTRINNIAVKIYAYNPDHSFSATDILEVADDVLHSAGEFVGYDAAPNYAFLFCLLNRPQLQKNQFRGFGALEHSHSSLYVQPVPRRGAGDMANVMSHEFMHILTPLNLHSEVIHRYNFATPTSDSHIWLYEGVTEWASEIMQMRSGLITPDEYMRGISGKFNTAERLDRQTPGYSLHDMSLEAFTPKGDKAFFNFYQRGALTAGLLDLRLLELSGGKSGLRELFLHLLKKFGKNRPFDSRTFYDVVVQESYPEIRDFINDYIIGHKPLPLAEAYEKVGFRYIAEQLSESGRPDLDAELGGRSAGEFRFENVGRRAAAYGLRSGDLLISVFGETVNAGNVRELGQRLFSMKIDEPFDLTVERDSEQVALKAQLFQRMNHHLFESLDNLTPEQQKLRDVWIKNL